VAVELTVVPLRPVLFALDNRFPFFGIDKTLTIVFTGMFVALNPTVTGFVVEEGNIMSGDSKKPPGEEGTATPATEVMVS
jgi:hypothetical protein